MRSVSAATLKEQLTGGEELALRGGGQAEPRPNDRGGQEDRPR